MTVYDWALLGMFCCGAAIGAIGAFEAGVRRGKSIAPAEWETIGTPPPPPRKQYDWEKAGIPYAYKCDTCEQDAHWMCLTPYTNQCTACGYTHKVCCCGRIFCTQGVMILPEVKP